MANVAVTHTDARRWFYHWMALACLAIAVLGFMPTFFLPIAQGTFTREPIFVVHGLLFFAWVVFFCTQTWLAASGRVVAHREWGLLGVALATAMVASTLAVNFLLLHKTPPTITPVVVVDVVNMALFGGCVAAAVANVKRPETHKRLMLLATVSLLRAPIGRWVGPLTQPLIAALAWSPGSPTPPNPLLFVVVSLPLILASLMLLPPMAFDWVTGRRVSPVYAIGLLVLALMTTVCGLIGLTPVGTAIESGLRGLGG